jgi:hypothetical protein
MAGDATVAPPENQSTAFAVAHIRFQNRHSTQEAHMGRPGRPPTRDRPTTLGFAYDDDLRERIDALARERHTSRSEAIRALVKEGLERRRRCVDCGALVEVAGDELVSAENHVGCNGVRGEVVASND